MNRKSDTIEMSIKRLNALKEKIGQPVHLSKEEEEMSIEDFMKKGIKKTIVIESFGFNHVEQVAFIEYFILQNASEDMQEIRVDADILQGWMKEAYPETVVSYLAKEDSTGEVSQSWYDIIEYGMTEQMKKQFAVFCAESNEEARQRAKEWQFVEAVKAVRKKYYDFRIGNDIPEQKIYNETVIAKDLKALNIDDTLLVIDEQTFQMMTSRPSVIASYRIL
jgi:hypothetical protein